MFTTALAVLLGLSTLNDPDAKLRECVALSMHGKYEESEAVLKNVSEYTVSDNDLYHFVRLLNNFTTNNKAEAEKHAKALDDSFQNTLPTRYKSLAYIMSEDLKHWKANDLGDIGRDMRMSGNRLDNGQGGEKTQQVQKTIVDKLDRLIKEQEDKNAAAAKAAQDKEAQARGKMPLPGQGLPAPESNIMGQSGDGRIDEKKLKQIAQNWGTLPEKERVRITQELTRDLPPKYKPMIEEYFKALNRVGK